MGCGASRGKDVSKETTDCAVLPANQSFSQLVISICWLLRNIQFTDGASQAPATQIPVLTVSDAPSFKRVSSAKSGKSDSVRQRRGSWAHSSNKLQVDQATDPTAPHPASSAAMNRMDNESNNFKSKTDMHADANPTPHVTEPPNSHAPSAGHPISKGPCSESFNSSSSGVHDEKAAVVILQKAARGMNGRATTKNLVASKQAAQKAHLAQHSAQKHTSHSTAHKSTPRTAQRTRAHAAWPDRHPREPPSPVSSRAGPCRRC